MSTVSVQQYECILIYANGKKQELKQTTKLSHHNKIVWVLLHFSV